MHASSTGLTNVHPSIAKLVQLLESTDSPTKVKALKSVFNVAKNERNRQHIMDCGAHYLIIGMAKDSPDEVMEQTGYALLSLLEGDTNINTIGSAGAIEAMVNLLESPRVDTVINAAKALAKLGITAQNKELCKAHNALHGLVNSLYRDNEWIRLYSTKALLSIFGEGNEGLHQELKNLNLESVFSHYANHIKSQGGQLY